MTAAAPRRFTFRPRVWLQRVHLWCALIIGLFILVVTLSGTIALYKFEINRWTHAPLYHVTPAPQPVSLDVAHDAIVAAFPDRSVGTIVVRPGDAYEFRLEGEPYTYAFVDPGTGQVNGSYVPEDTFIGWFAKLHWSLFLTTEEEGTLAYWLGETIFVVTCFALLIMSITGAFLWWPGVKRWAYGFKVRLHKSRYIQNYDWHKVLGFFSLPMFIMWAVTGLNFFEPWHDYIAAGWYTMTFSEQPTEQEFASVVTGQPPISLETARQQALAAVPDSQFISVSMPIAEDGTLEPAGTLDIWLAYGIDPYAYGEWPGNILVRLDQYNGAVLDNSLVSTPSLAAEIYNNWAFPLHAGSPVPWWLRTVWAFFGLMPLVLAITGVTMWWMKRVARWRKQRQPVPTMILDSEI